MKHFLTGLILMALSSQVVQAQMDIHCHMIPDSYLEAVKAHGLIPEGAKHWHGAAADSWMQHLTIHKDVQDGASNEWLEPVSDQQYKSVRN